MKADVNKWCRIFFSVVAMMVLFSSQASAHVGLYQEYFYPEVEPLALHHTPYTYANPYPHPYPELWKSPRLGDSKVKVFPCPTINGKRLDYCYKSRHYCGRAAANAFCRMNGYRYATRFFIERDVGETRNIFDGYVLPKMSRDGFTKIRCRT